MILILSDLTEVSLVFEQEESLKVVLIETAVKKGEKKCPQKCYLNDHFLKNKKIKLKSFISKDGKFNFYSYFVFYLNVINLESSCTSNILCYYFPRIQMLTTTILYVSYLDYFFVFI